MCEEALGVVMTERRGIITNKPISDENSAVHVIPSALGGRLKPKGIVSAAGNNILNHKVDLPLVNAFQPIMALLGGSRDRGKNPPVRLEDNNGRKYDYSFDAPMTLARPSLDIEEADGIVTVELNARTEQEARTLLGKVKKRYPSFDVNAAMNEMAWRSEYLQDRLSARLQIGPVITFPAAFVAASIYSCALGSSYHPDLQRFIAGFNPDGGRPPLPPDTFYWYPDSPWYEKPIADITHVVAFLGDSETQRALCCIEYFGVASVGVTLPFNGKEDCSSGYAVDVVTGTNLPLVINEKFLRSVAWQATHAVADDAIFSIFRDRLAYVLQVAGRLGVAHEVSRIIDASLGEPDGRQLTEQDMRKLLDDLTPFLLSRIMRARRT